MGCVQSHNEPKSNRPQAKVQNRSHAESSSINSTSKTAQPNCTITSQTAKSSNTSSITCHNTSSGLEGKKTSNSEVRSRSRSNSRLKPSNKEEQRVADANQHTTQLKPSSSEQNRSEGNPHNGAPIADPEVDEPSPDSRGRRIDKSRSSSRGSPQSARSKSRLHVDQSQSSGNLLTIHEKKPQSVCRASASVVRRSQLEPIKVTQVAKRNGPELNQYKKVKLIGSGATAKVHLYTNTTTGEDVAIKTFNRFVLKKQKMYTNDPVTKQLVVKTQYDKVLHEIEVLKYIHNSDNDKLSHVCAVHEIIDDPNHEKLYIVMEYGSLGVLSEWDDTMFHFTRTSLQTEEKARVIFLQILKVLVGLREIGVIHRDIKPQNIILTPTAAKIIDFGDAIVLPWKYPEFALEFQHQTQQRRTRSPSNSPLTPHAALDLNNLPSLPTEQNSSAPDIRNISIPNRSSASSSPGQPERTSRPQASPENVQPRRTTSHSRSRSVSRINPEAFVASTNVMDMNALFSPEPLPLPLPTQTPPSALPTIIVPSPHDSEFPPDANFTSTRSRAPSTNLSTTNVEKLATDNFWYQHGMIKESAATPYFSSPESCAGKYNGFDGDLWAFACTIYACVCGQLPFLSIQSNPDATLAATLDLIQNGQFTWPDVKLGVTQPTTPSFQKLIQWMLQKDPLNRPTLDMCEQHPWAHAPIQVDVFH